MSDVYASQYVVSAKERYFHAKFEERMIDDAREYLCRSLTKIPYKLYKVQWGYFGNDPRIRTVPKPQHDLQEFSTWEEIPKELDIVIRMRVEEVK